MISVLADRLRRGPKPPRVDVRDFEPSAPHADDDDHDGQEVMEESDLFGQSFGIIYRSASGIVTQRRVTIRRLCRSPSGYSFLRAYCWEREAARSFRIDRIETLYRLATGEVIESPAGFFGRYGAAAAETPPEQRALGVEELAPGMRALLYIARCDGDEMLEELGAIRWYAEERAKSRQFDWEACSRFLARQHPDAFLASKGLERISKDADHAQCLLKAAALLIDADGIITEEETKACLDLSRILQDAAR